MHKVECEIIGLSSNPSTGGAHALLLREVFGSRQIPIIIGQFEAQAIAMELEGIKPPRPLTHDLIKNLIDNLGTSVVEVVITELIENTYHAKIVLLVSSLTNEIDARPSDAIALALRTDAPIYVSEAILDKVGFSPASESEVRISEITDYSVKEQKKEPEPLKTKEAKLAAMRDQLREAVEAEDYERAAKLRDDINRLTGNN